MRAAFGALQGFAVRRWGDGRTAIAGFDAFGWTFELFGSPLPVAEQVGWRHFLVERRLLALGGERFRAAVMAAREAGAKTEPAFAEVLGLAGEPYAAVLALEGLEDSALMGILARAGL